MKSNHPPFIPHPSIMHLHIGHHFFGSGNLGDDLMLAGFLRAVGGRDGITFMCASPWADNQRRRFPQVQWLPYDDASRAAAIEACDAWVGVGGTPFQTTVGPWFLDHLAGELSLCRRSNKPMFLLGVGVDARDAVDHPIAREVLDYAQRAWTRDEQSGRWLTERVGAEKVTAAADLAHVWLRDHPFGPVEAGVTGYVLNFERPEQFRAEALCDLTAALPQREHRWLVQEERNLPGSERALLASLPAECRKRLTPRAPYYGGASVGGLVDAWGIPGHLLTSRYHAAVIGAWMRSSVLAVRRSAKVEGLADQLDLERVPAVTDASALAQSFRAARPVPHERLISLADRAAGACGEMLAMV